VKTSLPFKRSANIANHHAFQGKRGSKSPSMYATDCQNGVVGATRATRVLGEYCMLFARGGVVADVDVDEM